MAYGCGVVPAVAICSVCFAYYDMLSWVQYSWMFIVTSMIVTQVTSVLCVHELTSCISCDKDPPYASCNSDAAAAQNSGGVCITGGVFAYCWSTT